jgi:hypothetical protein
MIMLAPFDRVAYALLRAEVVTAWHYLGIVDANGREIARIDIATDPRATIHQHAVTGEVAISVRLRGDDPEIAPLLPVRLVGSYLYDVPTGGEPLHPSTISPSLIDTVTDALIYTHRLFIPLYPSS